MNQPNQPQPTQTNAMPDIAQSDISSYAVTLDWVGMSTISLPLQIPVHPAQKNQTPQQVNAVVECFVNLKDPNAKGIHMSRLYLLLTQFAENEPFSPASFQRFAQQLLNSHADISDQVRVAFSFDLMLKRSALKSQFSGWKSYPCTVEMRLTNGHVQILTDVKVTYSSTCPCSAALARQLVQQEFSRTFAEHTQVSKESVETWLMSSKGSYATPHSQRSEAYAQVVQQHDAEFFQFVHIIDLLEMALNTPVQTAVKREDEQEFARLNGHNLMFCEDAARRLHHTLSQQEFTDFKAKVSHFESLHAHDAVSMTSKGVANGLSW